MYIFIYKSPTSLPVSKYRKNGQKFQILPVQVKIFTEAEPRGIPASFKLIPIPHFENKPQRTRIPTQELNQQIKDNSPHLFFTLHCVRDK